MQTCNWVFRISNPVDDQEPTGWIGVKYCVWQKEKAASGLIHLQGYVVVPRCTLAAMKTRSGGAHWEPRRGTHAQAKAYSRKEETRIDGPWEFGNEPHIGQGKRNDLMALKDAVDGGASLAVLAEEHFTTMAVHSRWIREYRILKGIAQRHYLTYTTVLWGPPGSGKTSRVLAETTGEGRTAYWMKKPIGNAAFFDGYDGEEDFVIDEFYGWLSFDLLCRMCDRFPLMVDTKGGAVQFCPKRIWITSNVDPMRWYPKIGVERYGALMRRLSGEMGKVEYIGGEPAVLDGVNLSGFHVGDKRPMDIRLASDEILPLESEFYPPMSQAYDSDRE